ncbi:hypothetical protein ACHAXR_011177 [Thalassiosira sp. AJA248-18]
MDPFACFGDDGDDSDVDCNQGDKHGDDSELVSQNNMEKTSDADVATSANRDRARHLMETYNANKDTHTSRATPSGQNCHAYAPIRSTFEDQKSRTSSLPWPHRPPLYLGPMSLSDALAEGGGRGYVATQDIPPGTCVLIEEPLVKGWSEHQMGKRLGLESIQYLLEMKDAKSILGCMEELHPRKENDVFRYISRMSTTTDPLDRTQIVDMLSDMNSDTSHVQQVKALVTYANEHKITNSDGSPLDDRDINRLLLTLRYNGFDSGLYLHFSMFNHCEDPNCIKFRPTGENDNNRYYSEARTTRHVQKGEALTLHYLENPREVSHATRRKILWDQHRFDIGDEQSYKQFLDMTVIKSGHLFNDNERSNRIFESELVCEKFPSSTRDGSINKEGNVEGDLPATSNIENSLDDLEDMLVELQAMPKLQTNFDRAAAMELTIWELIAASQSALENNHHILLSHCRRLHLDVIELLLSRCASILTEKQSIELIARFLPSVQQLLESQRRRLGNDHHEVARTYNDFSMGIQALLSHSTKRLLALKLEGMNTLDQCSKMENHCRMEKKRIEEFYPRDVDEILSSVQKK